MNEIDALLAGMRDVHAPPVSAWPALGWWLLVLLVVLLCFFLWQLLQRRRRLQWRFEARAELATLRADLGTAPTTSILARCSALVRRLVLVAEPRTAIAGLHGEAWLEKLDTVCRQPVFSHGFGRLLLDQPYQPTPSVSTDDLESLLDAIDTLMKAVQRQQLRGRRLDHVR